MTTDFRVGHLAKRVLHRRMAGLAAVGLFGAALAPTFAISSAAAASCQIKDFSASADADLVTARLLDLRPLGADTAPVADLTISSASSWVDTSGTTKSRASADYLDAQVLGKTLSAGHLDQSVAQQAPPHNERPAVVEPSQLDADLLRVGTGHLAAHAKWHREYGCRTRAGVIAESFGSDLDAAILPMMTTKQPQSISTSQLGDGMVRLPNNAFSQTATELVRHRGTMATAATAWIGLAQLTLFGDTEQETTVRVVNPPELAALATGSRDTSSLTYTAPILEIEGPDGESHRIDSPGETFELTIPPSGPPTAARTESSPETSSGESAVPDLPGLLRPSSPGSPAPSPSGQINDPIRGLLEGLTGQSRGGSGGGAAMPQTAPVSDRTLTLRLSIGHVESDITQTSVRGEAASLRLQLLASAPQDDSDADTSSRTSSADPATLADVGLGVLSVAATAPKKQHSQPPATSSPSPAPGGDLPTTGFGFNLLAIIATGSLLLVAGRFLMLLARRRAASEAVEPAAEG